MTFPSPVALLGVVSDPAMYAIANNQVSDKAIVVITKFFDSSLHDSEILPLTVRLLPSLMNPDRETRVRDYDNKLLGAEHSTT